MKLRKLLIINLIIFLVILVVPTSLEASEDKAVFAGGCFWCLEHDLEDLKGVISVESGYTGGDLINPTYQKHQGHQEAVIVYFDSKVLTYPKLLRSYWRNIDALDGDGQFCDRGDAYKPVIFPVSESQQNEAMKSKDLAAKELDQSSERIKVKIIPFKRFWLAEDYHQNYAEKEPLKYNFYRYSCGRNARLENLWGQSARSDAGWRN